MKLYLAGIFATNFNKAGKNYAILTPREKQARDGVLYYLESYHYLKKGRLTDNVRQEGVKVFLDSGAFSAFSLGVEVSIEDYCDYVKSNLDIIETVDGSLCASVLDSVGDPLKTWQNQQTMESLGVRPLPCFHYGEDERYLQWYIERYSYITLGGMVPISTPQLIYWLDRLWDQYLTDGAGRPRLKVHGFGLTTEKLIERYPWYSVDSSSWVQIAAFGNILLPDGKGLLSVSDSSPSRRVALRHYLTLPDIQRKEVDRLIEGNGFELERLATIYQSRWAYSCWAYTELNRNVLNRKPTIFKKAQEGLF